jgi:gentisate 1,2-dioxygenase
LKEEFMTAAADPQSHYHVQLNRRFKFLEDWRSRRRELAKGDQLRMAHSPTRNARIGILVGDAGGVPTKMIDTRVMEIDAGQKTSVHRHAHDMIVFVLDGRGVATIDGIRHEFDTRDALHTPSWSWHRFEALERPVRLLGISDAPLMAALGLNRIEDIGDDMPAGDRVRSGLPVNAKRPSNYERELADTDRAEELRRSGTKITRWKDVQLRRNPKGTHSTLMVDRSLGYFTSGLSMALFEMQPGKAQAKHRHPGEAVLYIVKGRGYSIIEGRRFEWQTGDAVIVNQYAWHQHFNLEPDQPAVVIRMHMWESIIEIMQAAMDPIPLYEDDPAMLDRKGAIWDQVTPELASHRDP